MFPINFNFPYRKKDGSLITMEKALDGAGADLDLIDLDDVAITTPVDDDGLVYNSTSQKWKNIPIMTKEQWQEDQIGDIDHPILLSSSDNLNNVTKAGFYYWTTSAPTNAPESKTWCILEVLICGTIVRQVIYHSSNMYIREYAGSPISWFSWYKFTGTVVS